MPAYLLLLVSWFWSLLICDRFGVGYGLSALHFRGFSGHWLFLVFFPWWNCVITFGILLGLLPFKIVNGIANYTCNVFTNHSVLFNQDMDELIVLELGLNNLRSDNIISLESRPFVGDDDSLLELGISVADFDSYNKTDKYTKKVWFSFILELISVIWRTAGALFMTLISPSSLR